MNRNGNTLLTLEERGCPKETDLPFGSPRKRTSFFKPILKELEKRIRKFKNKCFLVLTVLKELLKMYPTQLFGFENQ